MQLQLINIAVTVGRFYTMLIIIYTLLTWVPVSGALYDVLRVFASLCEPWIGIFRRFIPPMGGIDFSPWAAILAIEFVIVPVVALLIRTLVPA